MYLITEVLVITYLHHEIFFTISVIPECFRVALHGATKQTPIKGATNQGTKETLDVTNEQALRTLGRSCFPLFVLYLCSNTAVHTTVFIQIDAHTCLNRCPPLHHQALCTQI